MNPTPETRNGQALQRLTVHDMSTGEHNMTGETVPEARFLRKAMPYLWGTVAGMALIAVPLRLMEVMA